MAKQININSNSNKVNIEDVNPKIIVRDDNKNTTVNVGAQTTKIVQVNTPGTKGPAGPPGPGGPSGSAGPSGSGGFPYSGSDDQFGTPPQAIITGSLLLSGSGHITASGVISASSFISASAFAGSGISIVGVLTSSFSNTSSFSFTSLTASFASSTPGSFPYSGSDNQFGTPAQAIITGSLLLSGSGHITSSGDISSSGIITADQFKLANADIRNFNDGILISSGVLLSNITASGNISSSKTIIANKFIGNGAQVLGVISSSFAVSASHAISASVEIIKEISSSHANFADLAATASYVEAANIDQPFVNITASGNISASGLLFISSSDALSNPYLTVLVDTGSGRLYYTGSYGGGGGGIGFPYSGSDNQFGTPAQAIITGSLLLSGSGHITSSGNISSSGIITAAEGVFGTSTTTINDSINTTGNITASGNISSSGNLILSSSIAFGASSASIAAKGELEIYGEDTGNEYLKIGEDKAQIYINGFQVINVDDDSINLNASGQDIDTKIVYDDGSNAINVDAATNRLKLKHFVTIGSGSASTPNADPNTLLVSGSTQFVGEVTASSDISASGNLFANISNNADSNFKVLVYDELTGQFFRTGSYGAAGGGGIVQSVADGTGQIGIDLNLDSGKLSATASGLGITDDVIFNHISASGNISGSTIEGQELISEGHITASGNISASGIISASAFSGDGSSIIGVISSSFAVSASHAISASVEIIKEISSSHANFADLAATASYVEAANIDQPFVNISASGNISGSTIEGQELISIGHITASGNISSSGNILAREIILTKDDTIRIGEQGGTGNFQIDDGAGSNLQQLQIFADSTNFKGNITSSGNISSSGEIITSKVNVITDGSPTSDGYFINNTQFISGSTIGTLEFGDFDSDGTRIKITDISNTIELSNDNPNTTKIFLDGIVTASSDISGSGAIFFSSSLNDDANFKTLVYDTSTGKIFHTGSYGGSGGLITSVADGIGQTGIDLNLDSGKLSATASGLGITDDVTFNHVTASGNISASGNLIGNNLELNGNITASGIIVGDTNLLTLGDGVGGGNGTQVIVNDSTGRVTLNALSGTNKEIILSSKDLIIDDENSTNTQRTLIRGSITASSNISSSFTSTGSFGRLLSHTIGGLSPISLTDDTQITGSLIATNITASNNISASGTIVASKIKSLGSEVVLENGHITASGNISASGIILASSFSGNGSSIFGVVSSSFAVSASHAISASVEIIKEISSSHADLADLALGLTGIPDIKVRDINAVNISASGAITASEARITGSLILTGPISQSLMVGTTNFIGGDVLIFGRLKVSSSLFDTLGGNITSSGNISASGNIIGNTGVFTNLDINGDINVRNITASGVISSSIDKAIMGGMMTASRGILIEPPLTAETQSMAQNPFLIKFEGNGQPEKFAVSSSGVVRFGALDTLPTPITGGLVYSASNFYMGLE